MVAAATVARMHAEPVLEADLAAARDELAKVRVLGGVAAEPGLCHGGCRTGDNPVRHWLSSAGVS